MANLIVVYDPVKEIAAIVDVDEQCGWGPAELGPSGESLLTRFAETLPDDYGAMTTREVQRLYHYFLHAPTPAALATPGPDDFGPMDERSESELDAAALAGYTAVGTGGQPPDVQPANTDVEADAGETVTVRPCPVCEGEGTVQIGVDETPVTCGLCNGDKYVRMAVQS